jgi:hypothetical protein
MPARKTTVAVVGDVTIDWMLTVPDPVSGPAIELAWAWGTGRTANLSACAGGAAAARELIAAAVKDARLPARVVGPHVPAKVLARPADDTFTRTYTAWAPFRMSADRRAEKAWRISSYLGEAPSRAGSPPPVAGADTADVLVVFDLHMGFSDAPESWPAGLRDGRPPRAVLLSAVSPLARGPLWERLVERHADDLTVFALIEDLRKDSLPVGYSLSWEQIYRDVVDAVRGSDLGKAQRVVVPVGLLGAVIVERDGFTRLVFDPRAQERDLASFAPGRVTGYMACVSAAVLRELVAGDRPDVEGAVRRGLTAARALHFAGFAPVAGTAATRLVFPVAAVARALAGKPEDLSAVTISFESGGDHRILSEVLGEANLERIAAQAAVDGPEKLLAGIPIETVGAWSSVDRDEIESMRSVRGIMGEYVGQWTGGKRLERPLSIAVFGPPGAGKSFAVKQIANVLLPGELTTLEFNLSQFHDPEELPASFHRVRDLVLQHHLPLVFWDEFDTTLHGAELGWLRHFLAPMQDGMFREAGVFHPIGPAIFVFAGGTSATLSEFITASDDAGAKNAKKPDFLSRLRGFVNVYGPNQLGENDSAYLLRRAFLLRSLIMRKAPQTVSDGRLQIDDGVLRAFLRTDRYAHGARSLEAIVDMSALAGRPRFERASLPPRQQLALHVDARQFLELVRG